MFRGTARVPAAIKRMHGVLVSRYNLESFRREAALARSLCHPNVVRTLGTVIVPDRETPVDIIMELQPGTLQDVLARARARFAAGALRCWRRCTSATS